MSEHVNYDLVRAVEKITKGIDRENGLGVELLGKYGIDSSGASTPTLLMENTKRKLDGILGEG